MTKISAYPEVSEATIDDLLIGTDVETQKQTKNFSIKSIVDLIEFPYLYQWIKSDESLSLAKRNGDVLYSILDKYTGQEMTLSKVTGDPVVDGIIYFQLEDEYFKRNYDEMNPRWFGAKGDSINDDSPAFQAAINSLNTGIGGVLKIDSGIYRLNTGLITYPKVKIQGNGPQNTFLYSYLTGENAMLTMDGASVSTNTLAVWSDFTAVSPISAGIAFLLLNSAYATYENIYSEGFFRHWRLRNCLSSQFTSVRARFGPTGAAGFYADSTGGSNPNALTLTSCVFGSLPGVGIRLDDPSNFNMYGGSVEACGIAGSSAIAIYNGGSQGAAAWNFNGVYFEGNIGTADIRVIIDGALMESAGVIQSCSFNRISATDFTTNNVLLQQSSPTDKYITIDMRGNAFINSTSYIPNVSRKYIAVQSTAKFRITEDSNFYKSEIEIPQIFSSGVIYSSSINVDASVLPLNGKLNITPTDGNAFTINAPTNARVGQEISFVITNVTGASLGNLMWDAGVSGYRLDSNWIQPSNEKASSITFIYTNYGLWMEKSRSNIKDSYVNITGDTMIGNLSVPTLNASGDINATGNLTGTYSLLTDLATGNILNSGSDVTGSFLNTNTNIRFLTNSGSVNPFSIIPTGVKLPLTPTTSVDEYDIITRNTTTGVIEKITKNTIDRLTGYTVDTLPDGTLGDTAFVTDATTPTYLGALTGEGTVICPVFHNGTVWVSN